MGKPTIGFLGTGMMGQLAHLANYARLRDQGLCEIAGVTDLKPGLAEAVAAKYGIAHIYPDAEALLADPRVDAVVCIQQWRDNYPLVKRVLQAGKSVLTEKPMVGRRDEAEELVALAKEKGVLYAVGFMKRYDTGVEMALQMIAGFRQSLELGPLLTVDALCDGGDWLHNVEMPLSVPVAAPIPSAAPTYPDGCDTPAQRDAYGYLVNIFSHNINLVHYLLGEAMDPRFAQFRGDRAMTCEARAGGALITVRGANSSSYDWREWTTCAFAQGEVRLKTPSPMNRQRSAEVSVLRKGPGGYTTLHYHAPVGWSFYRQAEGFVRALAGEEPLHAPAETCLWDVRAMEKIIQIAEIVTP
ncbi:MAG TPA: Gfo/Idh/MocA family oxidoreductase [Chthonomonadaceae bacterium]|nr:Gfo/Idh/MocA family oxidoreductase [Chthonomonadaceae bacterium]